MNEQTVIERIGVERATGSDEPWIVLSLKVGGVGNRARVDATAIETDADRDMLYVSRELWDSEELRAVRRFNGGVQGWVKSRSIPSYLRGGMWQVKLAHMQEVEQYLTSQEPRLRELVIQFADAAPRLQQDAKERQGSLYREGDYPSRAQILAAFYWEWRWLSLSAPASLRQIGASVWAKEQKKAEAHFEAALEQVRAGNRAQALKLAEYVRNALTPGEDGKAKAFKAPVVKKVTEYLDLLKYQADDPELDVVARDLRAAFDGIDPKDVREEEKYRAALAEQMAGIETSLKGLVGEQPIRKFSFKD